MNKKVKILVVVEGEKTDYRLIEHLLNVYGIDQKHEIVSYNTNIYTLYKTMFADSDPSDKDLLQTLKEHERDAEKKKIFDNLYSDVLLIFDLDPQDPDFTPDKIKQMANYFIESSDMGKLYLNYPMVESFYHMKSIPDRDYLSYVASMDELKNKQYKARVNKENRNHDYSKFAVNKVECDIVIEQNLKKAYSLIKTPFKKESISGADILDSQLNILTEKQKISVLCTCCFYILDYNPKLLDF